MSFDVSQLRHDYGDALEEARVCRRAAALFDFSFVARGVVSGPGALRSVQRLTTRRLDRMRTGDIAYGLREDAAGRLLADLTIWRLDETTFELMSGRREDVAVLVARAEDCAASDLSDETAIFAVQGPHTLAALCSLGAPAELRELPYFRHATITLAGLSCRVGRLGYTGEAGFEIIAARCDGAQLWSELSARVPCAGFAAANILRIEAGFLLFANELRIPVTAVEAGVRQFATAKSTGGTLDTAADRCQIVTFRAEAQQTPPLWMPSAPFSRPQHPGELVATSACQSPLMQGTLGLGYVRLADLERTPRPNFVSPAFGRVEILAHPFFDTAKQRPRELWPSASIDFDNCPIGAAHLTSRPR